jgi:hypothetical protein
MGAAPKQADTYRKGSRKTEVLGQDWEQRLAEARARRSAVLAAKGRGAAPEVIEKPWEQETFTDVPKLLDESRDNIRKAAVADHAKGKIRRRKARKDQARDEDGAWEPLVASRAWRGTDASDRVAANEKGLPREERRSRRGLAAAAALLLVVPVVGYVTVERFGLPSFPGIGGPREDVTAVTGSGGTQEDVTAVTGSGAPEADPAAPETATIEAPPGPVLSEPPARSGPPDTATTPGEEALAALPSDTFDLPDGTPPLPGAAASDSAPGEVPAPPAASVPRGDPVPSAMLDAPPTRNLPSAEAGALPAMPGPVAAAMTDPSRIAALPQPGSDGLSVPAVQVGSPRVSVDTVVATPDGVPGEEASGFVTPRLASLDATLPGFAAAPDLAGPPAAGSAPDVDAAAPEPLPAEPVGTGTVFFHAPDTVAASLVEREASLVAEATGLSTSVKEPVSFTISSSNVRYFHPEDREAAAAVAEALSARLRDFTDFEPAPDVGTIEVWLEGEPEAAEAASVAPAAVEPAPPPPPPAAAPAPTRRSAPVRARQDPAPTFSTTTITRTRPSGLGRIFGN